MSELPVEPQLAKTLLISSELSCSNEILSIVALLSVPNIFLRPKDAQDMADSCKKQYEHKDGDHLTLLNAYHAYKQNASDANYCYQNFLNIRSLEMADSVRQQLAGIIQKLDLSLVSVDISVDDSEYYTQILRCLVHGFFMQVAHLQPNGEYITVRDQQVVNIHPSSILKEKPPWIIFNDFVL